jgi:hypothetical protein
MSGYFAEHGFSNEFICELVEEYIAGLLTIPSETFLSCVKMYGEFTTISVYDTFFLQQVGVLDNNIFIKAEQHGIINDDGQVLAHLYQEVSSLAFLAHYKKLTE